MPALDWSLVAILAAVCGAAGPSTPPEVVSAESMVVASAVPPPTDSDPPASTAGDPPSRGDGRPGGQRRPLSPDQIDAIVEVATEVFPDGAARLRELRKQDPEALERVLGRQARRLFALAMLRDRNPELYALKLEELRNQMELRTLAARHAALGTEQVEDTEAASARERIEARIRAIVEQQVDLGLRVRGLELAAMDEAIRRMRAELAEDAQQRTETIAEMVDLILSGGELPPPEFRPDAGPRGLWGGRGVGRSDRSGRSGRSGGDEGNRRRRGDSDRSSPPSPF